MTTHDTARAAVDALEAERAAAARQAEDAIAGALELSRDLDAARARIAELEAGVPAPPPLTRIGMSAPKDLWPQRLRDVGAEGLTARRLFVQPGAGVTIRSRRTEVLEAVAAGMMPIISVKDEPTPSNVAAFRDELLALEAPVAVAYWHEPRSDIAPATYRARQKIFLGVSAPSIAVGPILNGFLLNRPATMGEWESWFDAELLEQWDYVGVDLYQRLDGKEIPGSQIPKLNAWLDSKGHPGKDIIVGEYNSFEASSIAAAGETFLSTPNVKVACVWNATGKPGTQEHIPLEGDRLEAFRATKADPRAAR